ncbi:MAG: hypothetical protein ABF244_00500 [Flavobacteriaceae bacterium]
MSAKGGITKGKSHKEGGIPMIVKSTGQKVELEGGEGVINKKNMADTKLHSFDGKEMTKCEIASEINSDNNNGVTIDCDDIVGKKYKYDKGGNVSENNNKLVSFDATSEVNELSDLDNLLGETMIDYEFQKVKRKANKFRKGGNVLLNQKTEVVYVVLTNDCDCYVYDRDGNNVNEINLDKEKLYRLVYFGVDNKEVVFALDELRKENFIYIDKEKVNVVGLNEMVKGIKPYQYFTNDNEWRLIENDIKILELIRTRKSYKVNEKYEASNFRGDNLANYLSTKINKMIYSLLFKGKQSSYKINNLFINNNGVGNLLSLAPNYIDNVYINFVESKYEQIERIIDRIQNDSNQENYSDVKEIIDAVIHVYKDSNPIADVSNLFISEAKKNIMFLGIAEFTSEKASIDFQKTLYGKKGEEKILVYKIKEGLSNYGIETLIYNISKS